MLKRIVNNPKRVMITMYALLLIIWCSFILPTISWSDFKENVGVPITMAFGSFIAGFTCEGGGAISFPVFTKVLHIDTNVARDFAFASQGVGMTFASISILLKKVPIEKNIIKNVCLGGMIGMLIGTFFVAPYLSNVAVKLIFTVMTVAFAVALILKNFVFDIQEVQEITHFESKDRLILMIVGMIGGIFSALTGSGIDFVTFSFVTLYYRVDEKVATPTSVIIMAFYASVTAVFKIFITQTYLPESLTMWKLAVPIVAIGAPIGAAACVKVSRNMIVKVLLILIAIELISTVLILKVNSFTWFISGIGLIVGSLFYIGVIKVGDIRFRNRVDNIF